MRSTTSPTRSVWFKKNLNKNTLKKKFVFPLFSQPLRSTKLPTRYVCSKKSKKKVLSTPLLFWPMRSAALQTRYTITYHYTNVTGNTQCKHMQMDVNCIQRIHTLCAYCIPMCLYIRHSDIPVYTLRACVISFVLSCGYLFYKHMYTTYRVVYAYI